MSEGLACFLRLRVAQQLVRYCLASRPTSSAPPERGSEPLGGERQRQRRASREECEGEPLAGHRAFGGTLDLGQVRHLGLPPLYGSCVASVNVH